ncbi:MAG: Crotonobetainyl-CoA:carnitine CoA-transferase CaiB [Chloroflexi bacterium]|jgi:crotonobetainyl-CoA:carnitine CoA-transferase CaiB-like acyl-CoA transferase|nr:MAG: Crotonobetainyl-CoA:carnitine CoA-transferase CaiB [Chloroflexota bacterium]
MSANFTIGALERSIVTNLPFNGIKILDLTRWLAGPIATSLLGDLGAEVIKVESLPTGDQTRQTAPFIDGESAYYMSINRNKKSVALNFRTPQGKEILKRLALSCDVLAENFKVGVTEQMGLGYETLKAENPRLVYGAITAYGLDGPYRDRAGLDQVAQGMGGLASVTGFDSSNPVRVGVPISDLTTGMLAAVAISSALYERQVTGKGRRVEVSLLDSTIGLLTFQAQKFLSLGDVPTPQGNNHPLLTPCGVFETSNGPMNLCVSSDSHWKIFCDILDSPELLSDPRFTNNTTRRQHQDELLELLRPHLAVRTREEWTEALSDGGIPAGPLYSVGELFSDPHVQARNVVETTNHATLGDLPLVRSPIRMEGMERSVRLAPPVLGQHTKEVLEDLGFTTDEVRTLLDEGVALQATL